VLNGTANTGQVATDTTDGIQITYNTARNMGVTAGGDTAREVALPGQPLRVDVQLKTNQATTLDSIVLYDAKNTAYTIYGTPPTTSTDWQTVVFTVPAGVTFPLRLNGFQLVETDATKQRAGAFTIGAVSVDNATPVDPLADPVVADPIVALDGAVSGSTFAVVQDAAGVAAAQATHPDFIAGPCDGCESLATPRTFDRGGTRFVVLNSGSPEYDQLALLQGALADESAVHDVVVLSDRSIEGLADRTGAALLEQLLSGSAKPVTMLSPGASIRRIEGVRYAGLPAGVTGWVRYGDDAGHVTEDVHAFASSAVLSGPDVLEVGDAATLSGALTQAGRRDAAVRLPAVHALGRLGLACHRD